MIEDNPETVVAVVAHDVEVQRDEGAPNDVERDIGEPVFSRMHGTSPRRKKDSPKREFETTSALQLLVNLRPALESKLSGLS